VPASCSAERKRSARSSLISLEEPAAMQNTASGNPASYSAFTLERLEVVEILAKRGEG